MAGWAIISNSFLLAKKWAKTKRPKKW